MDTRYWGPSGWDLFHRIASHSSQPSDVLKHMAEILPCKFCRNSTGRFIRNHPYDNRDPQKWLYEIHNMVNHKLRSQCSKDPKVINPGPDPSFEEVKSKFENKSLNELVGQEFLLSVAVNFKPTPRRIEIQKRFLRNLAKAYPLFAEFYSKHPVDFKHYPEWMNQFTKISIEKVETFRSKCKRGKTCRKPHGGGKRLTRRQSLSV
jgi:hypothetical protein